MHRLALPLLASLSVSLATTSAGAYCRSTVCKGIDACDGEVIDGCPPLVWASGCVGFSVQDSGGSGLDAGTVELISDLAFDAWRRADCGGQSPGLSIQNLGQVACGAVEYNKDAGNANIVFFSADWPHSEATHTYAITTTKMCIRDSAYAELFFTETLWPDFTLETLDEAMAAFSRRQRRFGKTGPQVSAEAG